MVTESGEETVVPCALEENEQSDDDTSWENVFENDHEALPEDLNDRSHRESSETTEPTMHHGAVARSVAKAELKSQPTAISAMRKEWSNL